MSNTVTALRSVPNAPPATVAETPTEEAMVARPLTALGVIGGVGVGIYLGSVLLAVVFVLTALAVAKMSSARQAMRKGLDHHFERRRRGERRRSRDTALEKAGIPRDTLVELTLLSDEVERLDPGLAHRFDIEDLLDRHVALALAHERCLRAMRMADRDHLVRSRSAVAGRRRADMFDRRIRYWDQCKEQADHCAEEMATLADLVRLLAQKAACPDVIFEDDVLERRLWELDEEESAFHLLSTGNG